MATLTQNTLVRKPDTGEVVALNAGEDVPEWAVSQVGSHLTSDEGDDSGGEDGYESMTVADLRQQAPADCPTQFAQTLDVGRFWDLVIEAIATITRGLGEGSEAGRG